MAAEWRCLNNPGIRRFPYRLVDKPIPACFQRLSQSMREYCRAIGKRSGIHHAQWFCLYQASWATMQTLLLAQSCSCRSAIFPGPGTAYLAQSEQFGSNHLSSVCRPTSDVQNSGPNIRTRSCYLLLDPLSSSYRYRSRKTGPETNPNGAQDSE